MIFGGSSQFYMGSSLGKFEFHLLCGRRLLFFSLFLLNVFNWCMENGRDLVDYSFPLNNLPDNLFRGVYTAAHVFIRF